MLVSRSSMGFLFSKAELFSRSHFVKASIDPNTEAPLLNSDANSIVLAEVSLSNILFLVSLVHLCKLLDEI